MDPRASAILIVVAIFLSAWYSAVETALGSANLFKLKVRANDGSKSCKLACKLIEKFENHIVSIAIGNNIANTVISTFGTLLFAIVLNEEIVNIVSTIVIAIGCFIICETLPKIIARKNPDKFLVISAYGLYGSYYLFWPFIQLFLLITKGIKKLFKIKENVIITEEDFSTFVDKAEDEGSLEEDESDLIQNAVDFDDISVKECFTPLSKMAALDIDGITNEELNKKLLASEYSRIPVYKKDIQNIVGILNVKKYFNEYIDDPHINLESVLNDAYFIDSATKIDDLFEGFKKNLTHIAIVKSKDKVIGMITMDDVLEELVGELTKTNKEEK